MKDILETLEVLSRKEKSEEYLLLINTICNLLNEEETDRFTTSTYSRDFKVGRLQVKVHYGK